MNPWGATAGEGDTEVTSSPLTRRIIEQSPRRISARYGYDFYSRIKRESEAETAAHDRAAETHISTPSTPVMGVTPLERAIRFINSDVERRHFLAAQPLVPLWEIQQVGVDFMAHREADPQVRGGMIVYETRLGKTRTYVMHILKTLQNRVRAGGPRFGRPTLILCPAQTVLSTAAEIDAFLGPAETRPLHITVLSSKQPLPSAADLLGTYDVVIASYDMLKAGHARGGKGETLNHTFYERIIADEAHLFANHRNQLFEAVTALQATYRWVVTATPIRNSLHDLYSAFAFLRVPRPFPAVDNPAFVTLLHTLMIRRRAVDLGYAIKDEVAYLDFATPIERHIYDVVRTQTLSTLREQGVPRSESQQLEIILRLRQSCSGPRSMGTTTLRRLFAETELIVDPERMSPAGLCNDIMAETALTRGETHFCKRDSRMSMLVDLPPADVQSLQDKILPPLVTKQRFIMTYYEKNVASVPGSKLIIFYHWANPLQDLDQHFTLRSRLRRTPPPHVIVHGKVDNRAAIFERFRTDPECRVLLITYGTGGIGLDLSSADHVIICDPWFNPFTEDQAVGRIHGTKQRHKVVHILRLVIAGTIDEKILELATAKRAMTAILDRPDPVVPTATMDSRSILIDWILKQSGGTKRSRAQEPEEEEPVKKKARVVRVI